LDLCFVALKRFLLRLLRAPTKGFRQLTDVVWLQADTGGAFEHVSQSRQRAAVVLEAVLKRALLDGFEEFGLCVLVEAFAWSGVRFGFESVDAVNVELGSPLAEGGLADAEDQGNSFLAFMQQHA
jgi:hypothetical protein